MKPVLVILLFFVLNISILCENETTIQLEGKITEIRAFSGSVYLMDKRDSHIWKINKQGKITAEFNRRGEGPDELKFITDMQFTDKRIRIFATDKYIETDLNLRFLKTEKSQKTFKELRNLNRIFFEKENSHKGKRFIISLLKQNKKPLIISEIFQPFFQKRMNAFDPFIKTRVLSDNKRFAVLSRDMCSADIFSQNGKLLFKITPSEKTLKTTEVFKNKFFASMFKEPGFKNNKQRQEMAKKIIYFPENFPAIQDFYIDSANSNIFLKTFESKRNCSAFLKYNSNGKFIKKLYLKDRDINLSIQSSFTAFDSEEYIYLYVNDNGNYVLSRGSLIRSSMSIE